jgi:hypothetical protein
MNESEKLIPVDRGCGRLKSFQVDAGLALIAAEVTRAGWKRGGCGRSPGPSGLPCNLPRLKS